MGKRRVSLSLFGALFLTLAATLTGSTLRAEPPLALTARASEDEAAPVRQSVSLTLVSSQGQAANQLPDRTLLRAAPLPLPDPNWDSAYFDDSGWVNAFPVVRRAPWNSDGGGSIDQIVQAGADHVWGGAPSGPFEPDDGGAINWPPRTTAEGMPISAQTPQTLFLRKTFCVALDADVSAIGSSALELMLATDFGPTAGAAFFNEWPVNTNLPGDGQVHTYGLTGAPYQRGQNTLALWAQDNRGDNAAAVLYRFTVNYDIAPDALTVSGPADAHVGQSVTFNAAHDGLSGRSLTFRWAMGDGAVLDTGATSSVNYAYPAAGSYTGVLTVTESGLLGCNAVQPFAITVNTAALNVLKSDRFDPVAAGDFLDYDLTVQNTGPVTTFGGVTVNDSVPADTTFVSCSGGLFCSHVAGVVTWDVGALAPGASVNLSFRVLVDNAPPPDPPLVVNTTYGASSGGGVTFVGATPITTTIIVLGTPTPTNTPVPTSTSPPTPTPTSTTYPLPSYTRTPSPTPTATSTAGPPPPTSPPGPTAAPPMATATPTAAVATPAFLPVSGQDSGGLEVGAWGGALLVLVALYYVRRTCRRVR